MISSVKRAIVNQVKSGKALNSVAVRGYVDQPSAKGTKQAVVLKSPDHKKQFQDKKPTPKFKEFVARGQEMDKFSNLTQLTKEQRILLNVASDAEFPKNYQDPLVLKEYMVKAANQLPDLLNMSYNPNPEPIVVTVTGAAGNIAYALIPRILSGEVFGQNQKIILKLLDIPQAENVMKGVALEVEDFAFPLLHELVLTTKNEEAFEKSDFIFMVGAKPRGEGMTRQDLLKTNAELFATQGKAINQYANTDVNVLVVGNPANTNALIVSANAPDIPKNNITALTRLDHDRGLGIVAQKLGRRVGDFKRFAIWGNHSATQVPDLSHTTVGDANKWVIGEINDEKWVNETFVKSVQMRGDAIIKARGSSSAASAADASIKHMRDWVQGNTDWVSMAVCSDGSYGVTRGLWSSFPIICSGGGKYSIVKHLPISVGTADAINASVAELKKEREMVENLIPAPVMRFVTMNYNEIFTEDYLINHSKDVPASA